MFHFFVVFGLLYSVLFISAVGFFRYCDFCTSNFANEFLTHFPQPSEYVLPLCAVKIQYSGVIFYPFGSD